MGGGREEDDQLIGRLSTIVTHPADRGFGEFRHGYRSKHDDPPGGDDGGHRHEEHRRQRRGELVRAGDVVGLSGPVRIDRLVPLPDDLPGEGWMALDEPISGGVGGEGELIDCVGPDFPGPDETSETAASPHYVRSPHQLVHGISVLFTTASAAGRAAVVLRRSSFAECLGRSVAADLIASPAAAEVLTIDVTPRPELQRVTFSTGSRTGVRPIHLDIAVLACGRALSLLWFADTPHPFPAEHRRTVSDRIELRLGAAQRDDPERDPGDG